MLRTEVRPPALVPGLVQVIDFPGRFERYEFSHFAPETLFQRLDDSNRDFQLPRDGLRLGNLRAVTGQNLLEKPLSAQELKEALFELLKLGCLFFENEGFQRVQIGHRQGSYQADDLDVIGSRRCQIHLAAHDVVLDTVMKPVDDSAGGFVELLLKMGMSSRSRDLWDSRRQDAALYVRRDA